MSDDLPVRLERTSVALLAGDYFTREALFDLMTEAAARLRAVPRLLDATEEVRLASMRFWIKEGSPISHEQYKAATAAYVAARAVFEGET